MTKPQSSCYEFVYISPECAEVNRILCRCSQAREARGLIENFFAKLKLFLAIATRYDKTVLNFLAAIHISAVLIWLI